MEPNNFEKDFREKLNQRTINPGVDAWDRLDAMLTVAEEKSGRKTGAFKKWLYIAASFLGVMLAATFYFSTDRNTIESIGTVVMEDKADQEPSETITGNTGVPVPQVAVAANAPEQDQKAQKEYILKEKFKSVTSKESSIIIKEHENQSANNQITQTEVNEKEKTAIIQLPEVAEKSLTAENSERTQSKIKINASDLLNQVDSELDQSFREKVISKVNKNYQSVRVALANRNIE